MSLKEWLESHECYGLREVRVTIGRSTFEGVFYRQMMPGGWVNMRGDVVEPYEVEAFMLLGELPASYTRRKKTVYRLPGDERDWYVAGWVTTEVATDPRYADMHYDGRASFQLRPWAPKDGEAIDRHDRYERVEVRVLQEA